MSLVDRLPPPGTVRSRFASTSATPPVGTTFCRKSAAVQPASVPPLPALPQVPACTSGPVGFRNVRPEDCPLATWISGCAPWIEPAVDSLNTARNLVVATPEETPAWQ